MRDELLKRARHADTEAHLDSWVNSSVFSFQTKQQYLKQIPHFAVISRWRVRCRLRLRSLLVWCCSPRSFSASFGHYFFSFHITFMPAPPLILSGEQGGGDPIYRRRSDTKPTNRDCLTSRKRVPGRWRSEPIKQTRPNVWRRCAIGGIRKKSKAASPASYHLAFVARKLRLQRPKMRIAKRFAFHLFPIYLGLGTREFAYEYTVDHAE